MKGCVLGKAAGGKSFLDEREHKGIGCLSCFYEKSYENVRVNLAIKMTGFRITMETPGPVCERVSGLS